MAKATIRPLFVVKEGEPPKDTYAALFGIRQIAANIAANAKNQVATFEKIEKQGIAALKEQQPSISRGILRWIK